MANNLDFRVKNGLAVTTTATIEGTTQATSTNTGAFQVYGGAGIAKDLYVGGNLFAGNLVNVGSTSVVVATTASTQIVSFSTSTFSSGRFLIQATQGTSKQLAELMVLHDGVTAIATEYGTLLTGAKLFTTDVDINTGNARVLVSLVAAVSTTFKTSYTLIAT
jgi:hypothetical protein